MAKPNKTTETAINVVDFINSYVDNEEKKADSLELIKLMKKWSGHDPKMWGSTIIGFGSYFYKYESGHEGEAPLLGFSPRKAQFSIYIYAPTKENEVLIKSLGKYKMGKACIYIKKLTDVDLSIMEKMSKSTIAFLKAKYKVAGKK